MPQETPEFLHKKYADLPGSKPVERAVRKARREGEPIPDKKLARIQTYLDRLEKVVDSERGWELLKQKLVKEFAINTSDEETMNKVALHLYESEKKRVREQGRTEELHELEQETRQQVIASRGELIKEKQAKQEEPLSAWLDYLQKNDAKYPMWFRYYVARNLSGMGALDKEKGIYAKRTKETLAPFPELNAEALGSLNRWLTSGIGDRELTEPADQEKRAKLAQLIRQADFSKLYLFAQQENAGKLNRESIEGQWVKYDQGSGHHQLEESLKDKGTGWCTATGSAYAHLQGGNFYVYYTKGRKGTFTEPRIAIRIANGQVAEVRGVRPNTTQELEPALVDIAQEKYHSLPGGEKYDKKAGDMKHLTEIEKKFKEGQQLNKKDLIFLYEMDTAIESFGYGKDPRIQELRSQRNPEQDMLVFFECAKDQIAHTTKEINQNTKAYVGKLEPDIFTAIQKYDIEHVYTNFPEGRIKRENLEIGGKDKNQLITELENKKNNISDYARDMLKSKDFITQKNREQVDLVRLTVKDLGFPGGATTKQIYQRAQELGLELCPAEVAPNYRLQYQNQPMDEWLYIGMNPISDRGGIPSVFELGRLEVGLWLNDDWANPDD